MNKSILSLITLSYLVIGCGGGNGSGESSSSQTTIETITEAKEAYNSLDMNPNFTSLRSGQLQKSSVQHSNSTEKEELQELIGDDLLPVVSDMLSLKQFQKSQQNQKITTRDCPYGGSVSTDESEDSSKSILTFNSCKNTRKSVLNGTITMAENQDNNSIKLSIDATNKDGDRTVSFNSTWVLQMIENPPELRFTIDGSIKTKNGSSEFSNLIYNKMKIFFGKDDSSAWKTVDGSISIENNCFTKHYTFTTPQKLRYGNSYENNTKSGILKINNSTYTFESPYVTIKTTSAEETILQSELKNQNTPIECK